MSGQSSIGTRINMIEAKLQGQTLGPPLSLPPTGANGNGTGGPSPRPTPTLNFTRGSSGGRGRPMMLPLPVLSGNQRSESEARFQKIIEKSGMLKINDQIYKTTLADMEDLGELGSGTSGHVVKMRHKPSGAIIAVKQMRRTGNDEENKRIIMDLDVVLKSENCRYIVKCLGCFITDADVWICMELMTTCFDKLQKKSKKPVPEKILGKVTVATVNALSFLKDQHQVIHRDVKPSNILIDDRGNIKLCDFGISGRLVDSNAKTRSAGCAAYMAPERIDPANSEYDIRADVWSLGITLVELATALFPYRGCKTDFEVLTKVLTSNPPRLPDDQQFSPAFQDFVRLCLQKDYQDRPKYRDLLRHPFIMQAEQDSSVDVAGWFRNEAVGCGIQLTTPQLIASGLKPAPIGALTSTMSSGSNSLQRPSSSASDQNRVPTPFENITEAVQAQSNQQKQTVIASSIPVKSNSSSSSKLYELQQNNSADQQQSLQAKLNSISLAPAQSTSSSTTPYDPRSPSPAQHMQQQHQMQPPQAHYLKLQPKNAIVSNSSNLSNIGTGPERNQKYKRSPFMPRRSADPNDNALSVYGSPKKESSLSSLGQSIFKNLTTSPFSHRKSEQRSYKPPLPGEDGGGGGNPLVLNGNRQPGFSNPSSPLMLNRKVIDINDEQQYKHLVGNTSPIVLQRFYHQQNQLRENKQQQLELQMQQSTNPFYQQPSGIPVKYSPLPSHRTVHHPTNPAIVGGYAIYQPQVLPETSSNIPIYQYQQLNLGSNLAPSSSSSNSSPKHKTGGFFNTFSRTKSHNSKPGRSGNGSTSQFADRTGFVAQGGPGPENSFPDAGGLYQNHHQLYGRQTLPEYGSTGFVVSTGLSNGDEMKDDTDLAKRRFASFVKLNLSTTGEKRPKDKHLKNQLLQQQQHHQQQQQHHQFGYSGSGASVAPIAGYNPSTNPFVGPSYAGTGIPSSIPPSAAVHVMGNDRRHRSPDPPPRFNRGQSPLLLHRKLEKLSQTGSPILNQRFTSASPSPPLPPRRGSESVPGSPQHIRTRLHYTPEPHRRPYRTIDQ
ncbi:dual specificity mitogen-activated protein kinase kinase hemipterous-like isoform X2 [Uranotaenia lowii]|uniref:dual specificity mitogen-activated protein kinase kinase hemipterous-like isoform X2 n=1 Tax=Uranotaenia lowii TaxID=190385 RepID=UPI00247AD3EE|nr:dual specificity mitogen-activated protein kinase kinase hemipterous-like isoform X2 [Uranotaenia lowii]